MRINQGLSVNVSSIRFNDLIFMERNLERILAKKQAEVEELRTKLAEYDNYGGNCMTDLKKLAKAEGEKG